jgi:hypothetical protein
MNRNNSPHDPPAYQEYASNRLSKREWRCMSLAEKGLSHHMRLECWANGSVPEDPQLLAKALGLPADEVRRNLTLNVLSDFYSKDEELHCQVLDDYKEKLRASRLAKQAGGAKGGRSTQDNKRNQIARGESKREGNLKANLQAEPKHLNTVEMNRLKENRLGVNKKELPETHRDWQPAPGSDALPGPQDYKSQSQGY